MIVANGRVDALEAMSALSYVEEHDKLQGDPLLDKVCSLLAAALADGDIDEHESNQLVGLLQGIINPCSDGVSHRQVQIEGKKFCLSGTFYHGSKECIKQFILQKKYGNGLDLIFRKKISPSIDPVHYSWLL